MRPFLLTVLLAWRAVGPVLGAELDYSSPGFWYRTYAVPDAYSHRTLELGFKDLDRGWEKVEERLKKSGGRGLATGNAIPNAGGGMVDLDWQVPSAEADRIAKDIMAMGTVIGFETVPFQRDAGKPDNAELEYKRKRLYPEIFKLRPELERMSAIPGFLRVFVKSLESLAEADRAAREWSILHLRLRGIKDWTPPFTAYVYRPAPNRFPLMPPPQDLRWLWRIAIPELEQYWKRTPADGCVGVPANAVAVLEVPDIPAAAEAARELVLSKGGAAIQSLDCFSVHGNRAATAGFSIPKEAMAEVSSLLLDQGELRLWKAPVELRLNFVPPPLELDLTGKVGRLSAEVGAKGLLGAPHVRALILDEIRRLEGAAVRQAELKEREILALTFQEPDNPPPAELEKLSWDRDPAQISTACATFAIDIQVKDLKSASDKAGEIFAMLGGRRVGDGVGTIYDNAFVSNRSYAVPPANFNKARKALLGLGTVRTYENRWSVSPYPLKSIRRKIAALSKEMNRIDAAVGPASAASALLHARLDNLRMVEKQYEAAMSSVAIYLGLMDFRQTWTQSHP